MSSCFSSNKPFAYPKERKGSVLFSPYKLVSFSIDELKDNTTQMTK